MVQVCESKKFSVIRAPVKPALIRWARERASYSLHQLSGRFPRIEAWERGETGPTLRQLEAFAKVTHAPIGFFFLKAPPVEAMPIPDFRTPANVHLDRPSPNLLDTVYLCQQRQHWYRDFVQSVHEPQLELVGSARINDDVVETAAKMRNALGIDSDEWVSIASWKGALRHLMAQADARGVLVMFSRVAGSDNRRRLDPQEFRGFALADPWAPMVFVNGADTTAAQMFTLAHELVHIWLGESGVSDTDARDVPDHASERWCSRVAAEFLVPLDAFREERKPSADPNYELNRLARRFKTTTVVILRRIHDAKQLSPKEFREAYDMELDRLNSRQQSIDGINYLTPGAYVSERFARALVESTLEGRTAFTEALRMLGLKKMASFDKLTHSLGYRTS